jgi:hypothetical protein
MDEEVRRRMDPAYREIRMIPFRGDSTEEQKVFYYGFRGDELAHDTALYNTAPTWLYLVGPLSAIGTKLAYERYFGPEETKKATETPPPPISKDEV